MLPLSLESSSSQGGKRSSIASDIVSTSLRLSQSIQRPSEGKRHSVYGALQIRHTASGSEDMAVMVNSKSGWEAPRKESR